MTEKDAIAMQRLSGRVAVITGAARGIGAAIAGRLARDGAAVVVADIDADEAERTAAALDGGAIGTRVDIADPASVAALAAEVERRFGACDILVNNAGVNDTTAFADLTFERYRAVLAVDLDGAVAMCLALVPLLRSSTHGRVVNIASIMGLRGARDSLAYSTAKGGIVNLTRTLACDLGDAGILVNAIAPGFIDTRMAQLPDGHEHATDWFQDIYIRHGRIPLRRPGQPDDVAAAAAFFCGDDCRYVTGQILLVDGGMSATF